MTGSDSIPASTPLGGAVGDPPTPEQPAGFKDRRNGLILFGSIQLLMALAILGIVGIQLLMIFGAEALAPEGMAAENMGSPRLYAVSAVIYLLLAAGVAWLGIGSIRCRRWARALTLVLAWLGLVVGLMAMVLMVSISQNLTTQLRSQAAGAEAGVTFALGCVFLALAFLYIIIPAAFVLFYRSPHVRRTCEHYDPTPRWTDRVPLPLLAGGILLVSMGAGFLAPLMGTPLPFFGALLTGSAAWIYALVTGAVAAVLVWGFFRRERWAWLGTLLLMTLSGLNAYVAFRGNGLARIYEAMDVPPEQLEEMQSLGLTIGLPWMMLASILVILGFYLWLGRYFGARQAE